MSKKKVVIRGRQPGRSSEWLFDLVPSFVVVMCMVYRRSFWSLPGLYLVAVMTYSPPDQTVGIAWLIITARHRKLFRRGLLSFHDGFIAGVLLFQRRFDSFSLIVYPRAKLNTQHDCGRSCGSERMATLGIEADWWLYVVLFAAIFILLTINVYIVVIWQHPDDKNEAYFPKTIVVSDTVGWTNSLCYSLAPSARNCWVMCSLSACNDRAMGHLAQFSRRPSYNSFYLQS